MLFGWILNLSNIKFNFKAKLVVRFFGILIILASLVVNPFYLDNHLSPDAHFDFVWIYLIGSLIAALFLFVGVFFTIKPETIIKKKKEIFLLLVTIFLCMTVVELLVRIYDIWLTSQTISRAFNNYTLPAKGSHANLGDLVRPVADDNMVYALKPNLDVFFLNELVRTNTEGFRDEEFQLDKTNNMIRIVGIGDSVIFGWGVEEEKRYLDLLEDELQADFSNFNWQTYNFGVPGYNLANSFQVFENNVLKYQPDLIIYGYVINDHCLPYFLKPNHSFFSKDLRILNYLNPYVRILQGQLTDYETSTWRNITDICDPRFAPKKYYHLVGLDVFMKTFKKLLEVSEAVNAPLVILFYELPPFDYLEAVKELKSKYSQFYLVDVGGAMQEYSKKADSQSLVLSSLDLHPSEVGHALIAQQLYQELQVSGLLEKLIEVKR